jgi:hypothetical protein
MVAQGVLPYQLEAESKKSTLTGLAGLPTVFQSDFGRPMAPPCRKVPRIT